VMNVEVANTK